ncbi:MAG: hypothetical protein FWG84_00950 [Bacteroidales bacterium]|nr:hypothetical protein [Bacteroidales bacterium]
MDKSEIKASILASISEKLDLWLGKAETIEDGYEYETEFMKTAHQVSNIMLTKSLGEISPNRKKKGNFRPASGKLK